MVFKEVPVRRVTFMKCLSCLTANAPAAISSCGLILLLFTNYSRPFVELFVNVRCSSVIRRVVLHVGKPECVCCICCLRLQYAGCICFWSFVSSASLFLGARACVRCWSHAFAVLQDDHFIRVASSASSFCCTTAQYSWFLEVRVVHVPSLSRLLVSRQHVTTLVGFARCCFSSPSH